MYPLYFPKSLNLSTHLPHLLKVRYVGRKVVWFLKFPLYFPKSLNLSTRLPHFEPSPGGFNLSWPSCTPGIVKFRIDNDRSYNICPLISLVQETRLTMPWWRAAAASAPSCRPPLKSRRANTEAESSSPTVPHPIIQQTQEKQEKTNLGYIIFYILISEFYKFNSLNQNDNVWMFTFI